MGKILILNLAQACAAIAIKVGLELSAFDKLELTIDLFRKAVCVSNIIQNGEKDDQKLFIEIDLPFLINGLQIDRLFVLHNGRFTADGARPVDLVKTRMKVLHDEEKETLVILIELQKLK